MFVQLTKDFLGRKAGERLELAEADAAGLPWLRDKVTLSDASSTLAPFVALSTNV